MEKNIRTYFDEHEWININRQKTGVVSNIRMLDIAKRIIDKYRGLCGDGRIFPVPHYNTCLAGIRAVAKRCGINNTACAGDGKSTGGLVQFILLSILMARGVFRRLRMARQERAVQARTARISPIIAAHRAERPRGLPLRHAPKPEPHPGRNQMTKLS